MVADDARDGRSGHENRGNIARNDTLDDLALWQIIMLHLDLQHDVTGLDGIMGCTYGRTHNTGTGYNGQNRTRVVFDEILDGFDVH